MPGKNLARQFAAESYYHVYNRGVNKRKIFVDIEDYKFFSALFGRHLGPKPTQDAKGREYLWMRKDIEVLAYCWMPNHFHLLVYQQEERDLLRLMMSVCTAYTMYFNKKYKRRGPLFENNYRASLISEDIYLQHISRYIHLNPKSYKSWSYSSYKDYVGQPQKEWLNPARILELFGSKKQYARFVAEYQETHDELDIIKHELADNI